ncbi:MAG: hypothetical protein HKN21_17440, partial [Candidatus Eisenbacteria bacterium]|nr:hypothetical protein [Candidatus Eisenbacteria bacterium]
MTRAMMWLGSHKAVTLFLGLIYYILTVVLHDQVQGIFLAAKDQFGLKAYTIGLIAITLGGLLLVTLLILKKSSPGRRLGLVYWFVSMVLIAVAYIVILVLPSEYIHIAQYAVLALFVYPLCRRFTDTVVWVTILGALDEWYQYAILHADWGIYFDFNDVVLNLLGGGMGAAVI